MRVDRIRRRNALENGTEAPAGREEIGIVEHDVRRAGAGEGTRTLGINLGKVALYQLSYARTQVLVREDSSAPE